MKRSGPLPRNTEIARRTELRRGAPLNRGRGLARTTSLPPGVDLVRITPLRRQSKPATPHAKLTAAAQAAAKTLAKDILGDRSHGLCEIRIPGECFGRYTNFCHRIAEGQGGPWLASNGVAGCGSGTTGCHGWCHRNPSLAEAHGWIVPPTYQVIDGRRVKVEADAFPAYLWRPDADGPEWLWLDDVGGALTVDQIDGVDLVEYVPGGDLWLE